MKNGMKGKSKAKNPIIGSAKSIKNWAKIGSALASLTRGISTRQCNNQGPTLSPGEMHHAGHFAYAIQHY